MPRATQHTTEELRLLRAAAACDAADRKLDRVYAVHTDTDPADELVHPLLDVLHNARDRAIAVPARSVPALVAKARVCLASEMPDALAMSVLTDMLAVLGTDRGVRS